MATPDFSDFKSQPTLDLQDPPDQATIDACVHCGFCLSTCPSYRVIGKETDSPRGRIYLMSELNKGQIPLSPATVAHFDSCLGCLACVSICPAGVKYDQLIAATRPQVERNHERPAAEKLLRQLIFAIFPYPRRLRWLMAPLGLYQRSGLQTLFRRTGLFKAFPAVLSAMESLLPPVQPAGLRDDWPEVIPAQGERRYRVGMLLGCVQRVFLPEVNAATIRVLTANGCEVVLPPRQGCCAALSHHQGQTEQTETLARDLIDQFSAYELDAIVINASGCGHTLKAYGDILAADPDYCDRAHTFAQQIQDVQEFLATIGLTAPLHALQTAPLPIAYQDACHMLHGQRIQAQPRQLLQQIPGVELREPQDAALCCGSAGIYNILNPDVGDELGTQKVQNLCQTQATLIASANVGCTLQIRKHLQQQDQTTPVLHPMQLLDYAIRQVTLTDVLPPESPHT